MSAQTIDTLEKLWDHWPILSHAERVQQFREMNTVDRANFFLQLSAHDQAFLLLGLPEEQRHVWIRLLAPDDAVDLIQEIDRDDRDRFLALLDEPTRKEVAALLAYKEDEAGGLMNPRFPRLRPESTVDEAISYLRREAGRVDHLYYGYVLDHEQHLLGVISLRQLFSADPRKLVRDVMQTNLVWVSPDDDQKEVASVVRDSRLLAIPVLDAERT